MTSLPQFSLGTAAVLIFAVCASLVLLRGMARVLVGTLVLGASAWLAFLVWQKAPELSLAVAGKSLPVITLGLPPAVFLATLISLRKLAKFVTDPFGRGSRPSTAAPLSPGRLVFRLLFALIPTSLLGLITLAAVHHIGAVADIRSHAEEVEGLSEATLNHYFRDLKTSIEATVPARLLAYLDPQGRPARIAAAKAVTDHSSDEAPLAIILDEPELTQLARKGKYGDLLRHPVLNEIAKPAP